MNTADRTFTAAMTRARLVGWRPGLNGGERRDDEEAAENRDQRQIDAEVPSHPMIEERRDAERRVVWDDLVKLPGEVERNEGNAEPGDRRRQHEDATVDQP